MQADAPSDQRHETRVAISVALGLWGVLFGPFVLTPGVPVYRDLLITYLPLRHFWAERVSAGHLPGWFPWEGLGRSFIGQGVTGTFHPMNLLYLVLDEALALRLEIAGAVLVGIVGQVLFARHLKLSAAAAVSGAMVLVLNGYALSLTSNIAYLRGLTMLPWTALFASQVLTAPRPAKAVAALAVSWALIPLGGDAATTLLAAVVILALAAGHGVVRRVPWLLLSALLAFLLAAPELLPASALHAQSIVANFRDPAFLSSYWALHPERLPELLGCDPAGTSPWVQTLHEPGRWAESVLLGIPAIALALSVPRQRLPLTFLLLGALGLWLALGVHGGLELGLRHVLPPLNAVRYPEKHLALLCFGLATSVAFGLERVAKSPRAVLPGLGVALVALLASWRVSEVTPVLLLSAAGLAVVWLVPRSAHAIWLMPLLLVATLWRVPLGLLSVTPGVPMSLPGAGRVWIERASRSVPVDRQSLQRWAEEEMSELAGDLGALKHRAAFGLSANLPLAPKRERLLFGWTLSDTRALAPLYGFDLALLADGSNLSLLAAPRAWVASPRAIADTPALIARLRAEPDAALLHPLVLGTLPAPLEGPMGEVSFLRDEVDVLVLEARATGNGLLVLNDLAADGWSATVDGQPAAILITNALVRGVRLPPGTHQVIFTYEVPRLKVGLLLAGLGLCGVLGLLGWRLKTRASMRE